MENIESARSFLEGQSKVAVWYAEYEGDDESILYANDCFSKVFGIPVDEILEKKKYQLVNPPDTPEETIQQYKDEDITAMSGGVFLSRNPFESGKDIVVVKLRFERGMLGLFQVVDSESGGDEITLQDLPAEIQGVVQAMNVE